MYWSLSMVDFRELLPLRNEKHFVVVLALRDCLVTLPPLLLPLPFDGDLLGCFFLKSLFHIFHT